MIGTVVISSTDTERTRRRKNNDSVLSDYFDDDHDVDEVEIYLGQKITLDEIDLLKWWDDHKESYPKLHKIAMFIHGIPATSAPSERKFSLAGNVLTCLRSTLDPTQVENLLLLYSNSKEFDSKSCVISFTFIFHYFFSENTQIKIIFLSHLQVKHCILMSWRIERANECNAKDIRGC